jgi:hypothetical protein
MSTVSTAIRQAVAATFAPERRQGVIDELGTIPDPSPDDLLCRPPAEALQAAVLVLAYGDPAVFDSQLLCARVEPRDVWYAIESPVVVKPGLTTAELVRRYQALNLPVPSMLADSESAVSDSGSSTSAMP